MVVCPCHELADLFVLAIEKQPGSKLFHAGAQAGRRTRDIITALIHGIGLSGKTVTMNAAELAEVIGFVPVVDYWSFNSQASIEKAQRLLGWKPRHFDLLSKVARGAK